MVEPARRRSRPPAAGGKAAVLFVDTFNGTFESENALAAARVLRSGRLSRACAREARRRHYCCGRTYLSSGMVERAKAKAAELWSRCRAVCARGHRDRRPGALVPVDPARRSAGHGSRRERARSSPLRRLLFEEFVAREARAGRFALALRPAEQPILLHAHCHQKAFGAVSPMLEVLRLIPRCDAGTHRELVLRHGGQLSATKPRTMRSPCKWRRLTLLPAVRARPDAIVVADGTSCRQQIFDGTQRESIHLVRLLDRLLPQADASARGSFDPN